MLVRTIIEQGRAKPPRENDDGQPTGPQMENCREVPSSVSVWHHVCVASAGLHGIHAPLLKPSVFLVHAMLRVWEIALLLGSGWLRLMGACSVGA